eukprot:TRINITY_DN10737_c0_g1_i1.p1 TRINITY_DN10737_c0_g1~~TRINITY_DN10737_c0_g1_i1.p1  ORF type:complete len:131 (-),score=20.42 TRINITY_DN10737_c0_g1_i1:34-426(-)
MSEAKSKKVFVPPLALSSVTNAYASGGRMITSSKTSPQEGGGSYKQWKQHRLSQHQNTPSSITQKDKIKTLLSILEKQEEVIENHSDKPQDEAISLYNHYFEAQRGKMPYFLSIGTVSYTHLTLPTIYSV